MTAVDALAISMLAVVLLSFGVVALLFFQMARGAARHDPEIEELMREALAGDAKDAAPETAAPAKREAWERESDWWRKEETD